MTHEEYHSDNSRISKSALDLFSKSPALYFRRKMQHAADFNTDSTEIGTAFHEIVLQPRLYWSKPTGKHHELVKAMNEALQAHPIARKLLSTGDSEHLITWTANDVACKAMIDHINHDYRVIVDLKKTRDASPYGFRSSARKYRYDVQAAFYSDGWEEHTGERYAFIFIAVSDTWPHIVKCYSAPDEMLDDGRMKYTEDLTNYRKCLTENNWPASLDNKITPLIW